MEKELNIAAILKDKPLLLKFYSTTFGRITFNGVHKGKVYFFSEDTNAHSVKQNGKMYDGGECIIFPSKEMRDWDKFAWKKGDVLFMDGCSLDNKTYAAYMLGVRVFEFHFIHQLQHLLFGLGLSSEMEV